MTLFGQDAPLLLTLSSRSTKADFARHEMQTQIPCPTKGGGDCSVAGHLRLPMQELHWPVCVVCKMSNTDNEKSIRLLMKVRL